MDRYSEILSFQDDTSVLHIADGDLQLIDHAIPYLNPHCYSEINGAGANSNLFDVLRIRR